jgi:hypothetical protein
LDALLVIAMLPLAEPEADGVKVTVKVLLWPVDRESGRVKPERLKPAPLGVAPVIVTVDPPVLVSVSGKLWLLPICTLPKLKLDGLGLRVPAVTPLPARGMLRVGFDALLVIAMLPLTDPDDAGVNNTAKATLWPAPNEAGRLSPLIEKPVPVVVA